MKKIILSFCLFAPLFLWAQNTELKRSYVFDFTNPLQLIPSVTPGTASGDFVPVTDSVFKSADGLVKISFSKTNTSIGTGIVTDYDWTGNEPLLQITSGSRIYISTQKAYLNSFSVDERSIVGDLFQVRPTFTDTYDKLGHWNANGHQEIDLVELLNSGYPSEFRVLTVNYELRADTLHPVDVYPVPGSYIYSFDQLRLAYSDTLKLLSSTGATIRNSDGSEIVDLVATVKDSVLTLSAPATITNWDTYIINIPKGMVRNKLGFTNAELSYPINIVEAFNTFLLESTDPAEGVVSSIGPDITLTFSDVIGGWTDKEIQILNKEGVKKRTAKIVGRGDSDNNVVVTFENNLPALTTKDIYTMVIPEGLVYDINYKDNEEDHGTTSSRATYNPDTTIEYNLGGLVFPSDEVLASAKELLSYEGVGYPAATSESRMKLDSLVNDGRGNDELFRAFMGAFYKETNVQMPEKKKWYTISSFSSDNKRLYLTYDSEKVTLTDKAEEAGRFKSICADTLFFQTKDGKYLHLPLNNTVDGLYEGTSSKNLTEELDSTVNEMTLARFAVEGVDSLQSFGLLSLYGCMGKKGSDYVFAYALINNETKAVMTNPEFGLQYFTETLTNAFRLEEVEAPLPEVKYVFTPDGKETVTDLRMINITFPELTNVKVKEHALITMALQGGNRVFTTDSIAIVKNTTNSFNIVFGELANGSYEMTIPEGTFTYELEGNVTKVQEIKFIIANQNSDFVYDLFNKYSIYFYDKIPAFDDGYIRDVDLNEFVVFVLERDFVFGISDKKVEIQRLVGNVVVAQGNLKLDPTFKFPGFPYCTALRLVLDEPIKEGSLVADTYRIVIHRGTIGDANYAKWLADPTSVRKEDCHVNDLQYRLAEVDNEKVAGITRIVDENGEDKVYDLTGRRMSGEVKAGIYIVNGRKVVVR